MAKGEIAVSVAEKLRALDEALAGRTKVRLHEQVEAGMDAKAKFVAALPQIVAVVEAAEKCDSRLDAQALRAQLREALAALDEALS